MFHPKPLLPLPERLIQEARRLRKEASNTSSGAERQQLIRRAMETEAAYNVNAWLTSPGLRAPT